MMSDWVAQHSGAASTAASLDMNVPGETVFNSAESYWGTNLTLTVVNDTVLEWRIDDMALKIVAAYFTVCLTLDEPPINFDSWT